MKVNLAAATKRAVTILATILRSIRQSVESHCSFLEAPGKTGWKTATSLVGCRKRRKAMIEFTEEQRRQLESGKAVDFLDPRVDRIGRTRDHSFHPARISPEERSTAARSAPYPEQLLESAL